MSSHASPLPLRDTLGEPAGAGAASSPGGRARALFPSRVAARVGAFSLVLIAACSLLIVMMAADRPGLFAPTTHASFYPGWMAGPLGGLWPGLTRDGNTLRYMFTAAIVSMYAAYLLAIAYAPRLRAGWAITAILLVHAIFLIAPPMALTDIFNYVNYGRMEVVHHLNPYTTYPMLEPHSDPSFTLSNWHQLLSPYGPLFTLLTFALVPLGVAGSFWAIKGIIAVASLATLFLVWKCARLLGRDPVAAIVLVGLNPIVLVWGLGGDHNDFLMMFLIVLGVFLLLSARARAEEKAGPKAEAGAHGAGPRAWLLPLSPPQIGAGAAFVTAAAIKASGGILIPVLLAGLLRTPRRLIQVLFGMVLAGVVLGTASLTAFGLHIPDLSTQGRLVTAESVPNLLGLAVGSGGETDTVRALMGAVLVGSLLACCVFAWRGQRSATTPGPRGDQTLSACGWASVALLLTLSWVLPWYVIWVLPLAALSSSRRLRRAALVVGAYLIVAWAPASGLLWNAIGFHPERTPLGRLHQRYVKELLN
ncbi:MAG: hypothetical protein M3Z95_06420 [Actinomycetota bacterium]|nr:hypothetical protein [Actinomycetota bacterium]